MDTGIKCLERMIFKISISSSLWQDGLGTVLGVADLLEHLAEKIENTGIIIKITE